MRRSVNHKFIKCLQGRRGQDLLMLIERFGVSCCLQHDRFGRRHVQAEPLTNGSDRSDVIATVGCTNGNEMLDVFRIEHGESTSSGGRGGHDQIIA